MTEKTDDINRLYEKLETLLKKQEMFSGEINDLRNDINKLKVSETNTTLIPKEPNKTADENTGVQSKITTTDFQKQTQVILPKPLRSKINILPRVNKRILKNSLVKTLLVKSVFL